MISQTRSSAMLAGGKRGQFLLSLSDSGERGNGPLYLHVSAAAFEVDQKHSNAYQDWADVLQISRNLRWRLAIEFCFPTCDNVPPAPLDHQCQAVLMFALIRQEIQRCLSSPF